MAERDCLSMMRELFSLVPPLTTANR
jgi:hypothetical protein